MSKMIFNGLEFVAGQEINNNGVFVDTDNLIDSGTYTSEFTYMAIQDCCLLFHVAGTTSTSGKLYIDGIVFQGIYTNSSDNDFKDYTFLKKGQVAKITSSQNATLEYAVYGLQSGTISNVQHNYSTSEQLIGTWIDGKQLYEITVNIGQMTNDTSFHTVNHGVSNIESVVDVKGSMILTISPYRTYPIPTYRPVQDQGILISVNASEIQYINNWQSNSHNTYVTFQYTKTTD